MHRVDFHYSARSQEKPSTKGLTNASSDRNSRRKQSAFFKLE